jgi:hypothetical protein
VSRGLDGGSERTARLLVRLYPGPWRARYGDELAALIVEGSGGRVPWRTWVDVVLAAARERLRGSGPPERRRLGGALIVLCAWPAFVVAGVTVQKFSEHWQDVTPPGSHALPSAAFDVLVAAAAAGSALVLLGVAAALPAALRFARAGGLGQVRTRLLAPLVPTVAAVPLTVLLVVWAHRLTAAQRNGHDAGYGALAVSWALLLLIALAAWTAAAVSVARRLDLPAQTLRLDAVLAAGVAASMAVMTVAMAVWWGALAASPSTAAAPLQPQLWVAAGLMLAATLVAGAGAARALAGDLSSS